MLIAKLLIKITKFFLKKTKHKKQKTEAGSMIKLEQKTETTAVIDFAGQSKKYEKVEIENVENGKTKYTVTKKDGKGKIVEFLKDGETAIPKKLVDVVNETKKLELKQPRFFYAFIWFW